ncbi:MAG: MFS transporter [Acidimicrobiales bacterium]
MAELRSLPRSAVALALALFTVGWGTNVSTPFLTLYADRLDLGESATVAIFVVYVVGILGALLVAGPLSDRYGRRVLVIPFVALSAVASLVMIAGRDEFVLLLLGRLLLGAVSGAVFGVGAAWMLELLGDGRELQAALLTTVVTYAGFGFGPVISSVYERWFAAPLVVPFLIHVVATLSVLPFVLRVPETMVEATLTPLRVNLGVPESSRAEFVRLIVPAAVWVFAFPSTAFALFPVLLKDAIDGFDVVIGGASGALTAWAAMSARPIVIRVGPRRALSVGMALGLGGYVLGTAAFITDTWVLVLPAAPLLGAASGALATGCLTLLGRVADDSARGNLTSTFYLLAYPGMAMPLLVTAVGSVLSIGATLLWVTALALIATAWVQRAQGHLSG